MNICVIFFHELCLQESECTQCKMLFIVTDLLLSFIQCWKMCYLMRRHCVPNIYIFSVVSLAICPLPNDLGYQELTSLGRLCPVYSGHGLYSLTANWIQAHNLRWVVKLTLGASRAQQVIAMHGFRLVYFLHWYNIAGSSAPVSSVPQYV